MDQNTKRKRKPKATPKGEQRLLQGRLNSLTGGQREMDAIEMLDHLRNVEKMDDRTITGDLLLLMRAKYQEGYQPPSMQPNTLTRDMQEALTMILNHIKMLSTLDLSSLRSQPAWNEDHFQAASTRLHESAADFLGQSKRYDDDD
jgi:hypothetical protein